jgi:hypothetical protein
MVIVFSTEMRADFRRAVGGNQHFLAEKSGWDRRNHWQNSRRCGIDNIIVRGGEKAITGRWIHKGRTGHERSDS